MGHHLPHTRPINETPFGSASLAANQDPTRGVSTATQLAEGRNAYIANLYRPFKGFGRINMVEFNENSNYNSLQLSATRRFSRGLLLSANYTLSRANGISTGDQDTARFDGNTKIQ